MSPKCSICSKKQHQTTKSTNPLSKSMDHSTQYLFVGFLLLLMTLYTWSHHMLGFTSLPPGFSPPLSEVLDGLAAFSNEKSDLKKTRPSSGQTTRPVNRVAWTDSPLKKQQKHGDQQKTTTKTKNETKQQKTTKTLVQPWKHSTGSLKVSAIRPSISKVGTKNIGLGQCAKSWISKNHGIAWATTKLPTWNSCWNHRSWNQYKIDPSRNMSPFCFFCAQVAKSAEMGTSSWLCSANGAPPGDHLPGTFFLIKSLVTNKNQPKMPWKSNSENLQLK